MQKMGVIGCFLMFVAGGILLFYSPDNLSLIFTVIMLLSIAVGIALGMVPAMRCTRGFLRAQKKIERARTVESASTWLALQQEESLFDRPDLNNCFQEYRFAVKAYEKRGEAPLCDLEDYIGEEAIRNASRYRLMHQIPGTLTGLGILGTFMGLIFGLQKISFSSVSSTMEGVEFLLSGVRTAFYTSIAGVIFSILFNLTYNLIWDDLSTQLDRFLYLFYLYVLPRSAEVVRQENAVFQRKILQGLDELKAGLTHGCRSSDDEDGKQL